MTLLLDELSRNTGVRPSGHLGVAGHEMPLLHRCGNSRVHELLDGLDGTTQLVAAPGSANRTELGLDGNVFQWMGACAYPETTLILIWDVGQDLALPGVASPWDSGGLKTKGTVGRTLTGSEARVLLASYSLQLSAAREYLGAVLECSFEEPGDYLGGRPPTRWYPGWARGTVPSGVLPPAFTFEVRRPCAVPVVEHLLAAVVDEYAFAESPKVLRRLRSVLASCEAQYEPCRPPERCDAAARRFVWQHLRDRGAL